jgi:membrane protease YdiL (CAAX protease family)
MTLAFFAITFAVSWSCWIAIAMAVPLHSGAGQALAYLGTFAPALVALMLSRIRRGGAGVRTLVARVLPRPIAARWVAFALGYMLAIKLAAALLHRLVSGHWPAFGTESLVLIPFAIALSTPVQAGEELGWRGFALPRLAARLGLARASLLLGLVWAFWHLPLFFVREADTYGQSFVIYAVQVVAISVAIAMLYARTEGGLFLPMLFHAAVNNTKDVVPSAISGAHAVFSPRASLEAWLAAGLLWTCTGFILAWMARTETERRSRYAAWAD